MGAQCKMKMQGLLLKTEDFPVETAEHEAKHKNLLRGGESLGYCTGCVQEELYSSDFPLTSFLNSHKLVFLGARSLENSHRDLGEHVGHSHLGLLSMF